MKLSLRRLIAMGSLLVATAPHIVVIPIVGPINLVYSIIISTVSLFILSKVMTLYLMILCTLVSAILQFVPPVPYWLCVDEGYRFCTASFEVNIGNATYTVVDLIVLGFFVIGYALWYSRK